MEPIINKKGLTKIHIILGIACLQNIRKGFYLMHNFSLGKAPVIELHISYTCFFKHIHQWQEFTRSFGSSIMSEVGPWSRDSNGIDLRKLKIWTSATKRTTVLISETINTWTSETRGSRSCFVLAFLLFYSLFHSITLPLSVLKILRGEATRMRSEPPSGFTLKSIHFLLTCLEFCANT